MDKEYDLPPQESIENTFGSNVFNESVMRTRLPKSAYLALKRTIDEGIPLEPAIADIVANAMKDWAIEKGATHFTHWFQPMTGITAEKHESFISPTKEGKVIMEFSGRELIKGEPDASSFPSGGLRATFEARGYTAWDCTSPTFIKDGVLCIPTAFCSYTGEALDKKTPLLRSMEALSKQAVRVLRAMGNSTVKKVISTVGAEQEYFVIDKTLFEKRKDLVLTGRTLFGAKAPKGQELEDHYFVTLNERIANFMNEVDQELWKMGVMAKTKHNEVAPSQHEIAPIFTTTNIATDHNQLVMETLKKVANRHGLVCLLYEKPFAGINGSGKHNNWSMCTNEGNNLLEPGSTPHENEQFLLFLATVIEAVDEYAALLRASAANPGNDHRLGANEAPPAIISIFLGDQLTDILEQLANGGVKKSAKGEVIKLGVSTLPVFPKDSTDRNRTSPFAFTGNKFEFRMVPSSTSIADPNMALNTIVAETLSRIADRLEKADDVDEEIETIIKGIVKAHKRVIFNGNNYSEEWIKEAEKRGLPNITTTVDAIPAWIDEKVIRVFEKHSVLSRDELFARYDIYLENYINTINIEALTMIEMVHRQLLPAALKYAREVAETVTSLKQANMPSMSAEGLLRKLVLTIDAFKNNAEALEKSLSSSDIDDLLKKAQYFRDEVFATMNKVRVEADKLETLVDGKFWPIPTYADLLFSIM
ncbi:MAG: glutamine synthetase III [Bacteroidetes bacterium]|nr:glutamine synthetase III [Bacteroidota bacterium]HOV99020.1 glutamine synthetase III [Bacteroidota bacterium]